jgi:hypothetical protein
MATSYWKLFSGAGVGRNRFSLEEVQLNAFELSIFTWCMGWCSRYENGRNAEVPVQTFDRVKYLLLASNDYAYMKLLD